MSLKKGDKRASDYVHNPILVIKYASVLSMTKFSNFCVTKWKFNIYIRVLMIILSPASQTKICDINATLTSNQTKTIMSINNPASA